MNHTKSSLTITIVLTLAALTYAAGAQEDPRFLGHHEHQGPPVDIAKTMADSAAGLTLPFWQRTVNAFNDPNQPYTITIIGRDPKLPNPPPNGVPWFRRSSYRWRRTSLIGIYLSLGFLILPHWLQKTAQMAKLEVDRRSSWRLPHLFSMTRQ